VYCRTARAAPVLAAALMAVSCSKAPQPKLQRIAVLRFENLTPAVSNDWMGRALAEVITSELTGAPGLYAIPSSRLHQLNATMGVRPISAPGISAEAPLAVAAGANRVAYGYYSIVAGRLRTRLTIEEPAGGVRQGPIEVSVDAADVIGAGTALAKAIWPEARPYGTSSAGALEAYTRAMEAGDPAAIVHGAEQAIATDANFGSAYSLLAEMRAKLQDRAGAQVVVQAALARGDAIQPIDRVRLGMLNASLRGDPAAMEAALGLYVKTAPLDPAAWRAVANLEAGRHQYGRAMEAYRRALDVEPEDATSWNELGYMAAYAGNFDAAMAAARRYQELRPQDPNPLDTMGDINVMAGRLAEAERFYLEAHKKNPTFLGGAEVFKAAMAHLMTGDVAGADAIAGQGPLAATAEWQWISGRRKQAFAKLSAEAAGFPGRDAQARAFAELTIWALLLGDREAAARMSQQAASLITQASAPLVAVARFVALPAASAEEWASRAAQMFPNAPAGSIRDYALAYALLLNREFASAVPVLKQLEARLGVNGDRSAAIELAWALVETGNVKDAAPLVKLNPVPSFGPTAIFEALYFPRVFDVRARVGENAGENRRVYRALGGE
jgi:tetratricopeptide (TPR) repeat protein